ncbi:MAG: hypothetical protein O2845_06095 [Proteobacteria bacterium]|nr:hypothetical protein [Pseudomonadota bacterium]
MLERANKTLICSVAYLDIVGYSSRPVPEQMRLKQRLNDSIAAAIKDIPLPDRVMLGPVKLVKDINGQPNLIGDGVNTGECVMSFAEPGQIMVSRLIPA